MTEDTEQISSAAPRPELRMRRRRGTLVFLRDVVVIILIAMLVSFVIKTVVVRSFYIPSGSMKNTLQIDDRILVDEITPRFGDYSRGDIVVFRDPGGWLETTAPTHSAGVLADAADWFLNLIGFSVSDSDDHLIKRVIGVPGDHVVCCNALGQLTVNGTAIDESSYILALPGAPASQIPFDVVVPPGSLWVLGDNRNNSRDSRYHQDEPGRGFVPVSNVVGRAFLITWPLNRFGPLDFHHGVFASVPSPNP